MYIPIIFLAGFANAILQIYSKNILFTYFFVVCTVTALSLDYVDKKIGKIFIGISLLLFMCLFAVALHHHILYSSMIKDYFYIMTEIVIISLLTVIAILPIKRKRPSTSEGLFVLKCELNF